MENFSLKSAFDPFSSDNEIIPTNKFNANLLINSSTKGNSEEKAYRDENILKTILDSINLLSSGVDSIANSTNSSDKLTEIQKNLYMNDNTTYNKNITKNNYKSFLKNISIINSQKKNPNPQNDLNKTAPNFIDRPSNKMQEVNTAVLGDGGYVDKPTLAVVGESGPELITPLSDPKIQKETIKRFTPKEDHMVSKIASNEAHINKSIETKMKVMDISSMRKKSSNSINPTSLSEIMNRNSSPQVPTDINTEGFSSIGGGGVGSFGRSLHQEIKIPAWRTHFG